MKRIFAKGTTPEQISNAVVHMMQQITPNKAWQIEVVEWKPPKTAAQARFLWGVVYPYILEAGGEALRGWHASDIHEYMLEEFGGAEEITGFGRTYTRPIKRSSRMTKKEFTDYLEFISQRCADMGIVIPEPVIHE